ncbi:MAG TPA: RidA family protein [Phycisphaerae bacterium]|nr:RidA family protein [Phycisphaerae bacterium]
MSIEDRLSELGWKLPPAAGPLGAYVPVVRTGNLLFVSGQLPLRDGKLRITGHVGGPVSEAQAQEEMRQAAFNALAIVRAELGSLDQVRRVVRLVGYVASAPDFTEQAAVTNAASEVFLKLFGPERGSHARLALGAAALPKGSPVELELIIEAEE